MSGKADSPKRRKRRKTRAERNMFRNNPSQQQDQKHKSSKKDQAPSVTASNPSLTYKRGSSKGASIFVPANYKTVTSGTITQSKITTSHHMFTNSKSSDCIKRGPIPETDAVKKKVEDDLKRILNFAETNKKTTHNEFVAPNDAIMVSQDKDTHSGAEISVMEVDGAAESCQMVSNLPPVDVRAKSSPPKLAKNVSSTSVRQVSSVASSVTSKPKTKKSVLGKAASSCESTFSSPEKDKEYLDPEVPIEAAADKFVKELNTKIALMFPNRDIQKEISYDLQKLVKSSNASSKSLDSTVPFSDNFHSDARLPNHRKPVANPIQSAHMLSVKIQSNANVVRSSPGGDIHPYPLGKTSNGNHLLQLTTGTEIAKSEMKSFCPGGLVKGENVPSVEPIIKLVTVTSDSSSDSFEVDDGMSGLTAACCNAFIADARDLEKQKYLLQNPLNSKHHCIPNLHQNNETYFSWMDASPNLPSPLPPDQQSNVTVLNDACHCKTSSRCHLSSSADKRDGREMRSYCSSAALRQSQMHQLSQERHKSFGDTSNGLLLLRKENHQPSHERPKPFEEHSNGLLLLRKETLQPSQERHKPFEEHSNGLLLLRKENFHPSCATGSHVPANSFLPHIVEARYRTRQSEINFPCREMDVTSFSNLRTCPDGSESRGSVGCECKCYGHHDTRCGDFCHGLATHQLGPHIIQSRQNLQIALDSACQESVVDCSFKAPGDHRSKDGFSSMFEQAQTSSLPCVSNLNFSWHKHGTIHTNQVDMQRQARDFLDDLEENSQPDFKPRSFFPKTYIGNTSSSAQTAASRCTSTSGPMIYP